MPRELHYRLGYLTQIGRDNDTVIMVSLPLNYSNLLKHCQSENKGVTGLSQNRETKTFLSYAFVCGQIHKLRKVKMECSSGTFVNLNNVCARFQRLPVYASMRSVINQFGDQSLHLCNFSATK